MTISLRPRGRRLSPPRKALFLAAALLTASTARTAPVDSLFLALPAAEMPELERSARMDLLDLWASGLEAAVPGALGDTLRLTERTDSTLTLTLADAATWRFRVTPGGRLVWEREVRLPGHSRPVTRRKEY